MADYPVIPATESLVIPQQTVEEKVYPRWWMESCDIRANDLNGKIDAHVVMRKYREVTDAEGVVTRDPAPKGLKGAVVGMTIEDIFTLAEERIAASKPALAQAVGALLGAVVEIGLERNVL